MDNALIEETKRMYSDIINLPHPVSRRHHPMPMANRAAQFAPFAALVGYDTAIDKTSEYVMRQADSGFYDVLPELQDIPIEPVD
ncbi:MAG: hypothetical protein IJ620_01640 [Bacteroidales bacterium]|nr:hypothetical protein [Bacteroidales bacterium]